MLALQMIDPLYRTTHYASK